MALICRIARCREAPGMCVHEKIAAVVLFVAAAMAFLHL